MFFRKPCEEDRNKINKFLILLRNEYIPSFSKEEREQELKDVYSGGAKAIIALSQPGEIIGYIAWKRYHKNKEYGYIANLAIHPKFRRKGISMRLRKMAFAQIKKAGYRGVYYTTWHKNTGMIESSKKIGMKIVKVYLDEGFRGSGGKTILFRKDFCP